MQVAATTGRRTGQRAKRLAAALCVAAGLAGCGPVSRIRAFIPWMKPEPPDRHAALQHPVKMPVADDLVRAVGDETGGGVPVDVRFRLLTRPQIGESAKLDLVMVPSAPLDRLVASFNAEPGLSVAEGAAPMQRDQPQAGVPIQHELTIVAQRDGIFYVTATVLADSAAGSVARTFIIPVIAGSGLR